MSLELDPPLPLGEFAPDCVEALGQRVKAPARDAVPVGVLLRQHPPGSIAPPAPKCAGRAHGHVQPSMLRRAADRMAEVMRKTPAT